MSMQVASAVQQQLATQMGPFLMLALALILAATVSTFFIWRHAGVEADEPGQLKIAKTKRGSSRVAQFVDSLDEREFADLQARLMADADGEAMSLEELMAAREQRR